MAVSQIIPKTPSAAQVAEPKLQTYYEVTLNRVVSFYGFTYTPSNTHVVDADTLKLLGDAVAEKKQIKG